MCFCIFWLIAVFKIRNNLFMRPASSPLPFFRGEDNQRIQLKRMLIKVPVPTPQTIVQRYFRLTGRKWRMVSSLLFRFISRAWGTHTPCLSTWLHLRFSYRMKILLVVVSIVFCYQKYIIYDKVRALSWTGRYPVAWTVRNLWRILA